MDGSWNGNTLKICISHVTEARLQQRRFLLIRRIKYALYGVNQSHSPATPVLAQWTHEQRDHGGRARGYMHGLNNMDLPLPRLTCTTHYCLTCQEPRPILRLQYGINLMGNSHPHDSSLIILGLFHHRGQRFILLEYTHILDMIYNASASTTI